MKKQYSYRNILTLIFAIFTSFIMLGQVNNKVSFELRKSQQAPGSFKNTDIYRLQGDFTMIGNSNLFNSPYSDGGTNGNNSTMSFHKLTGDPSAIKNSSSANLELPSGVNKQCTQIVYAGLYWSGRGDDSSSKPLSNGLVKNKIKIKLPGKATYEELTAADIHYGDSGVNGMYTGYIDITEKVRNLGDSAWGTFAIADVATTVGNGSSVGFYGGWGIVVIYGNPSMKWRDITVFDGFSHIAYDGEKTCTNDFLGFCLAYEKTTTFGQLEVSGFRASQSGDVKVKMGMMAGEGDRSIDGDVFDILKKTPTSPSESDWHRLNHSANTSDNFFNSSILTGNNVRVPNRKNNYGMDVVMFDLPNTNNQIIANNQSSTKFRFGTVQDTYAIFNIVFAVDAYVPELIGENKEIVRPGKSPALNGTIEPSQEMDFELSLFNKGSEEVKNTTIEIPIPSNLHFVSTSVVGLLPAGGTAVWQSPAGGTTDPAVTAGGKIIWTIGDVPLNTNRETLLAKLKYTLRASTDCMLLVTNSCGLDINLNGTISGTGKNSKSTVKTGFISGYDTGVCKGPIYGDFKTKIALSSSFLQQCAASIENEALQFKAFCSLPTGGFLRKTVIESYPSGTKFFSSVPTGYASSIDLVTGNFPINTDGSKTTYYAVVPGMENGCYAKLELSAEIITTVPTAKNVSFCMGESIVLENTRSQEGINQNYDLFYFDANGTLLTAVPNPTTLGVHTYYVAEGKGSCYGDKVSFTITIVEGITISNTVADIVLCENFDTNGSITIPTTGTSYNWEYLPSGSATWLVLTNNTFKDVVITNNNTIKVEHATLALNGIKVRLQVTNGQCNSTSNAFNLQVKGCPGVTNPMLLNPAIQ